MPNIPIVAVEQEGLLGSAESLWGRVSVAGRFDGQTVDSHL